MFRYHSGEEVRSGDLVRYHGDPGRVEFVITRPTGDPAADWHLELHPSGGAMIAAEGWGRVFVTFPDEDLDLVSRANGALRRKFS